MNEVVQQSKQLENYKYKTHREQIEKAFDSWLQKVDMNILMADFFGIDTKQIELITQEERAKFKIYLRHVSKRLINAFLVMNKNKTFRVDKIIEGDEIEYEMSFEQIVRQYLGKIMMHDLAHTVLISDTKPEEGNSIVPPFFKQKDTPFENNNELIKQELYAGLWQTLGTFGKPYSLMLLNKRNLDKFKKDLRLMLKPLLRSKDKASQESAEHIKRVIYRSYESFEDYVNAYFALIFLLVEGQNKSDAYDYADKLYINDANEGESIRVDEFVNGKMQELEVIFSKMIKNKDPKTVEKLAYIWDNRENPRVLVDLFFIETSSYFEKLDSRYGNKKNV